MIDWLGILISKMVNTELAACIEGCQYKAMRGPGISVLSEDLVCCPPLVRAPIDTVQAAALSRVFKALADPARVRLLSLIGAHAGREACVCELADAFDLSQPTISHHLKVLREAGLIDSERRGTWVYYRVLPGVLEQLSGLFTPVQEETVGSAAVPTQ
jgi:ArsR family transcriptional regulator, arsenate/arsenite/antimonite-responsive transcriptional repressor